MDMEKPFFKSSSSLQKEEAETAHHARKTQLSLVSPGSTDMSELHPEATLNWSLVDQVSKKMLVIS